MDFADKAGVIGQLWIEFRNDEDFSAFMDYNDLGCPMAYMVAEGLIKELTPVGEEMISETFKMFLDLVNVTEEEVDSVLPDKNLGSILVFAHNKKKNTEPDEEPED
jgi:hypothetical protein